MYTLPRYGRIDLGKSITKGLVDVTYPGDGNLLRVSTPSISSTKKGASLKGDGAASYFYRNSAPASLNLASDYTIMAMVMGATGSTDNRIYSFGNSASSNQILAISSGGSNAAKMRRWVRDSGAAATTDSDSVANVFEDNVPHVALLRNRSNILDLYVDGQADLLNEPFTAASSTFDRTAAGCLLRGTAGAFNSAHLIIGMLWTRALSDLEVRQVSENPAMVFSAPSFSIANASAGGGSSEIGASNVRQSSNRRQFGIRR